MNVENAGIGGPQTKDWTMSSLGVWIQEAPLNSCALIKVYLGHN